MDTTSPQTPHKGIPLSQVPAVIINHWENYQKGIIIVKRKDKLESLFRKWGFLPNHRKFAKMMSLTVEEQVAILRKYKAIEHEKKNKQYYLKKKKVVPSSYHTMENVSPRSVCP